MVRGVEGKRKGQAAGKKGENFMSKGGAWHRQRGRCGKWEYSLKSSQCEDISRSQGATVVACEVVRLDSRNGAEPGHDSLGIGRLKALRITGGRGHSDM